MRSAEPLGVMVQVNTSGEESKSVEPGAPVVDLAKHIAEECANLRFRGLMTIGMPDYTSRPENFGRSESAGKRCAQRWASTRRRWSSRWG